MASGIVFDIKEFTLHDGPGIRTTVFLKGCPLDCVWCHNPEGKSVKPQLMITKNSCTGCGECRCVCDHEECKPFDRCIKRCVKGNIKVCGIKMTAEELAKRLQKQKVFFENGGGGITVSGGEPLMQHEFLKELLTLLNPINCIIETSGFASEKVFSEITALCDEVFLDIKHPDDKKHIEFTGVSNKPILKNLENIKKSGVKYTVRVPLIPGINAFQQVIDDISRLFDGDCGNLKRIEFLPYNDFANAKHDSVDMPILYEKKQDVDYNGFSFEKFTQKGIQTVVM